MFITQTENFVFVAKDNKAEKRNVVPGNTEANFIEIITGLAQGEEIITQGNRELSDGETITVDN